MRRGVLLREAKIGLGDVRVGDRVGDRSGLRTPSDKTSGTSFFIVILPQTRRKENLEE